MQQCHESRRAVPAARAKQRAQPGAVPAAPFKPQHHPVRDVIHARPDQGGASARMRGIGGQRVAPPPGERLPRTI